jgi:hypothetical protein
MTMTTGEPNLPNSAPARLNPSRSEWNFRMVRVDAFEDAMRLGYYPHDDVFRATPYWRDSIWMEWLCKCPDPLS